MKKYIIGSKFPIGKESFLLSLIVTFFFIFTGCDEEGELSDSIADGYYTLEASFIYPDNVDNYMFSFHGDTIEKIGGLAVNRGDVGTLNVVEKGQTTPVFNQEVTISNDTIFQFIKLPGESSLELYKETDFIQFNTTLSLFEGYEAIFNGQTIVNGENYMKRVTATGNLEFYKEDETNPVYSIKDMTIENEQNLVILQSSANSFVSLEGGSGNEEAPATENRCRVNFFYEPSGTLNIDSLQIDIYSYDIWFACGTLNPVGNVVAPKGNLSPYIELDLTEYKESYNAPATFACGLYGYKDGVKQEIYDVWNAGCLFSLKNQQNDDYKTEYKFATYQITTSYSTQFIFGEEWESVAE